MRKVTIIILLFLTGALVPATVMSQQTEIDWLQNINQSAPGLKPVSIVITETTIPINLAIPGGMGLYALFSGNDELMKDALGIALASGINWGLTEALKRSFGRERPDITYPGMLDIYEVRTDFAMPSGHTSSAFSTATSLTLRYPEWYVAVPAYVWATSVGYSRMHLGLHYPTDILAGAALGAGSAWLSWKLNQWFWNRYDLRGVKIKRK
jgi:membrane-associated phospholipid phosphatase